MMGMAIWPNGTKLVQIYTMGGTTPMSNDNDNAQFQMSIVDDIPMSKKQQKGSMYDPLFVDIPMGKYNVVTFDDGKQCAIKYSIIRGLCNRRGWNDKYLVQKRGNKIYISHK